MFKIFHDWKPGIGSVFNSTAGTVQFTGSGGGGPNFAAGTRQFSNIIVDAGVDPGEFVAELLERAESDETFRGLKMASEEAMRDIVNMMACKAAVKAGDRLSQGELAELMDLRGAVDRASNCPHGRPTTVRLTIKDLEKLFGRI